MRTSSLRKVKSGLGAQFFRVTTKLLPQSSFARSIGVFLVLFFTHQNARAQFLLHCGGVSVNGSFSSSTNVKLLEIAGQPHPLGSMVNANFILHPGFIPCLFIVLPTGVDAAADPKIPTAFTLRQNYPNPFSPLARGIFRNPETAIVYELPQTGQLSLIVFNVLGQKVKTLINGVVAAGTHTAHWKGTDEAGKSVAAGIYLVRMEAGGVVLQKSMTLLK